MTHDQQRVLIRFNEKVARLEALKFTDEPRQAGSIVEWKRDVGWSGIHVGPADAERDATVLSLRFFLQNNEATSLSNMAALYPELGADPDLVDEFLRIRHELNDYLNEPSNLSISEAGPMTRRQIVEMFLWGDLAHANANHEATYRAVSQAAFFPLFQSTFVFAIRSFIQALRMMRDVNLQVLGG